MFIHLKELYNQYVKLCVLQECFYYLSVMQDSLLTFNSKKCSTYYIIYCLMLVIPDKGKMDWIMAQKVKSFLHCI